MKRNLDLFGADAGALKEKTLWLFDMDGTLYQEETLFDGTLDLLDRITRRGGRYIFITNNSSRSVEDYVKKVTRLGITADADSFFTSTQAAVIYLNQKYSGKMVYCQGTKSFVRGLRDEGIHVTEEPDEGVEVVLVGFDTELTSEKLYKTCEILSRPGTTFLATNPDLVCPVRFGFIPDCGSICGMLQNATGRIPVYLGKPEPIMVDYVRDKWKTSAENTVVVGDRLYTDIAAGLNAKVATVCVLTGEATVEEIQSGDVKPAYTFSSVRDIEIILA